MTTKTDSNAFLSKTVLKGVPSKILKYSTKTVFGDGLVKMAIFCKQLLWSEFNRFQRYDDATLRENTISLDENTGFMGVVVKIIHSDNFKFLRGPVVFCSKIVFSIYNLAALAVHALYRAFIGATAYIALVLTDSKLTAKEIADKVDAVNDTSFETYKLYPAPLEFILGTFSAVYAFTSLVFNKPFNLYKKHVLKINDKKDKNLDSVFKKSIGTNFRLMLLSILKLSTRLAITFLYMYTVSVMLHLTATMFDTYFLSSLAKYSLASTEEKINNIVTENSYLFTAVNSIVFVFTSLLELKAVSKRFIKKQYDEKQSKKVLGISAPKAKTLLDGNDYKVVLHTLFTLKGFHVLSYALLSETVNLALKSSMLDYGVNFLIKVKESSTRLAAFSGTQTLNIAAKLLPYSAAGFLAASSIGISFFVSFSTFFLFSAYMMRFVLTPAVILENAFLMRAADFLANTGAETTYLQKEAKLFEDSKLFEKTGVVSEADEADEAEDLKDKVLYSQFTSSSVSLQGSGAPAQAKDITCNKRKTVSA